MGDRSADHGRDSPRPDRPRAAAIRMRRLAPRPRAFQAVPQQSYYLAGPSARDAFVSRRADRHAGRLRLKDAASALGSPPLPVPRPSRSAPKNVPRARGHQPRPRFRRRCFRSHSNTGAGPHDRVQTETACAVRSRAGRVGRENEHRPAVLGARGPRSRAPCFYGQLTTTGPVGAALPPAGSIVTSMASGSASNSGPSAMMRPSPWASTRTSPRDVHVAP